MTARRWPRCGSPTAVVPQGQGHPAGGPVGATPADNAHVKSDLAKIAAGKKLSPILLVRGNAVDALQIADGYHRVCASYLTDENTPIPCRLASWETRD